MDNFHSSTATANHFVPLKLGAYSLVDALNNGLRSACASSGLRLEDSATSAERVDQPLPAPGQQLL